MKIPRYIAVPVVLKSQRIKVYASPRVSEALADVAMDMDLYKGVKLAQILDAVYEQGKKDGARTAFDKLDEVKALVPHKNPGRPRKK